jgi:hypothetical protein
VVAEIAVALSGLSLTAGEKFVSAIENRPLLGQKSFSTRILRIICKSARQRNFLPLAAE